MQVFGKYYYDARNNKNINVGEKDSSSYTSGIGIYDFKGISNEIDVKNKIRFKACDKANNCSNYGKYQEVWIDTTQPKCNVTKEVINGEESSYGWLGINEIARVIATCEDNENNSSSGCVKDSFYYDYNYQIKTTTAGANGNNNGRIVLDKADNYVICQANQTVLIDKTAPYIEWTPKQTVFNYNENINNEKETVNAICKDDLSGFEDTYPINYTGSF